MAGIDKTYVSWEQYKRIKEFFTPEMKEKQKKDLRFYFGYASWKESDFKKNDDELPVWNTPTIVDLWLAQNCKLDFIQERLHQQYGENWLGFNYDLDFSQKGFLVSAEMNIGENHSYFSPFKKISDTEIQTFDKILVYGTTFFYSFFYTAMSIIAGKYYNVKEGNNIKVEFELFGLYFIYKEGKYYINDKEVGYCYFSDYLRKDFFEEYKIKHSYRKRDFIKYEPEQIMFSFDDECYSPDMYKGFEKEHYKRYFFFLPRYIRDFIK
jgi:hypothetical protein